MIVISSRYQDCHSLATRASNIGMPIKTYIRVHQLYVLQRPQHLHFHSSYIEVPVGFVPTSRRMQTLGWIRGPKALKNHRWLFNFFLFCSLRQKIICTGHEPADTSPAAVTTTWEVYLNNARWTITIQGSEKAYSNMCAVTSLPPTESFAIPSW